MPASDLALKSLWHAIGEIGVRERGGINRGPEVDDYLRAAGLDPERGQYPWCAAFVVWCFQRAANDLQLATPLARTAGVFRLWEAHKEHRTQRPEVGALMIQDHGGGRGHCGLVIAVGPRTVVTVEGNTNGEGSRDGDCVAIKLRLQHDVMGYLVF
jgi:hypothetical protein